MIRRWHVGGRIGETEWRRYTPACLLSSGPSTRLEDSFDRPVDIADVRHAIHPGNQTPRLVISQDRRRLGPVFSHSGADRFLIVVGPALALGRSAHIADAGRLRHFVALVIAFPPFGAGLPPGGAISDRTPLSGNPP